MTPDVKPITLIDEDPFESKVAEMIRLHRERNAHYKTSPLQYLPIRMWLSQIAIKAVRAYEATTMQKLRDELLDTAVYVFMVLEQIDIRGTESVDEE